MPGGDRTGPRGLGPMSGRGMGWCSRPDERWYTGFGKAQPSWGRGRGWRHCYYATGAPGWARPGWSTLWAGPPPQREWGTGEDEWAEMKSYASRLEQELSNIKARMAELEKERQSS